MHPIFYDLFLPVTILDLFKLFALTILLFRYKTFIIMCGQQIDTQSSNLNIFSLNYKVLNVLNY